MFSLAVALCEHCYQSRIAKVLASRAKSDSIARQLRRYISDEKWSAAQFHLIGLVGFFRCIGSGRVILLVDETTSGGRFRCMMVGAAYKRRCIPLI